MLEMDGWIPVICLRPAFSCPFEAPLKLGLMAMAAS
jgi:hypothetical protein